MPELPEVETVRDGVARHVLGRTVAQAEVLSARTARRMPGGGAELAAGLRGQTLTAAVRRGKFLWITLSEPSRALLVHLGMSGQLLVRTTAELTQDPHPHLRARLVMSDGAALDFVDQRTFGYLAVEDVVPTPDGGPGGQGSDLAGMPRSARHIARDLLDPDLDLDEAAGRMRRRRTTVKRALLDQTLVSGVGNIYADEALWRAGEHPEQPTDRLSLPRGRGVLEAGAQVMTEALAQGGTSFDELYVNVNGASGYFDRSLNAYGQQGRACARCGTPIRRVSFANRSSHFCPRCQRKR